MWERTEWEKCEFAEVFLVCLHLTKTYCAEELEKQMKTAMSHTTSDHATGFWVVVSPKLNILHKPKESPI